MQSLLSASETNAFQSFLSIMDYSEDSLTNSEWALLQAPPPNPEHFYVDHHDHRDSLSRATKDLITLQPDRWRGQPAPYDSYPRHIPQERMHDTNMHPHYISRQHQQPMQQQQQQNNNNHYQQQHQRNSMSSSSSASYPYPPKAYHSMQPPPPIHHHPHQQQHHSPSPGPTPTSASSQQAFPPIQRPMSAVSMHDPSSSESLLGAPLRGISPSHSHSHSHSASPMVSSSSLRHALQRSPSEVHPHPNPPPGSASSSSTPSQHPHPAHLTSSASLSSRRARTSSTPPIPLSIPGSGSGAGPSSGSVSSSTTATAASASAPKQALLSPSQKKANHIQSEQKRRANIRRGYEALCETVPTLREAIRAEEEEAAMLAERGPAGGRRRRKKSAGGKEEKDKIDGRAGPRSENVVLMKTIEHIQTLLSDTDSLKSRLHNARGMLPPGHPALMASPHDQVWEREWKGGEGRMGTSGPGEDGEESDGDEED